jgi:hypothetical protein
MTAFLYVVTIMTLFTTGVKSRDTFHHIALRVCPARLVVLLQDNCSFIADETIWQPGLLRMTLD